MKILSIAFLLTLLFSSCYVNKVYVPAGHDVKIAEAGDIMETKVEKKQWYALWGLVPITSDRTPEIIQTYGFDEVKVESKITFVDFLIGIFTSWVSIVPQTVVVEGTTVD